MELFILLLLVAVVVLWLRLSRQAESIRRLESDLAVLLTEVRRRVESPEPPSVLKPTAPPEVPGATPDLGPQPALHTPLPAHLSAPPPVPPPLPTGAPEPSLSAASLEALPPPPRPADVPTRPPAPSWRLPRINWEQFLGVKLFAWLGGFALFLAAAFFLKYSFDHDLIPPALRAAMGYVLAVGLVVGGLRLGRRQYEVLAATLVGTGVVILYSVTFACNAHYRFPFFGPIPTFLLMVLITVAAFLLAVRMNAQVIAILGLLGGFLTPVLIQTGRDNPPGLFAYILLLDLGLLAVIWHRRWHPLAVLAAVATVGMQLAWISRFYVVDKLIVLQVVQPLFAGVFAAFFVAADRGGRRDRWLTAAFLVPAGFALLHGLGLAVSGAGNHPVRLFVMWLAIDAIVLAAVLATGRPRWVETAAGALVFLLLAAWTSMRADAESLLPALAAYFAFAVLHTALPLVRLRQQPGESAGLACQLFPAAALVLFALPILRDAGALPGVFWVGMLGIIVLALLSAAVVGGFLAALAVLGVSLVVTALAFLRGGPVAMEWSDSLVVVAGFAVVFVAGGWWLSRRKLPGGWGLPAGWGAWSPPADPKVSIAGSGAVLPFLLLTLLVSRATADHLHSLFGMTALLVVLVLGLARTTGFLWLVTFGLVGATLVEASWYARGFWTVGPLSEVAWYLVVYALFTAFPFLVDRSAPSRPVIWYTAAAAGPVHFLMVYLTVRQGEPLAAPGLIPAAFAVPALATLAWLVRHWPVDHPQRLGILAVQGGVGLLFITLVFPIQFSREWLTLAWALEGAALLWLFRRLPHPGLRLTGLALLGVAFVRLTLNPAILEYHPRSGTRIWNWYLYTYLVGAAAQFAAAKLLRPPAHLLGRIDVRGVLRAFGVLLLFVLMNLEIADYFAEGNTLTFEFTGSFARDLSYTIGWGLFALALLIGGIAQASRPTRYAGLGLLAITLAKLFLHDLARLEQLYRIGAFAGVAVIAIVASFLYQRFLNRPGVGEGGNAGSAAKAE